MNAMFQYKPDRGGRGVGAGEQLQLGACGGADADLRRLRHRRGGFAARLREGPLRRGHRGSLRRLHRLRHQGKTQTTSFYLFSKLLRIRLKVRILI